MMIAKTNETIPSFVKTQAKGATIDHVADTAVKKTAVKVYLSTHRKPQDCPPPKAAMPKKRIFKRQIDPSQVSEQPAGPQLLGLTSLFKLPFQAIRQYINYHTAKKSKDEKGKLDAGIRILSLSLTPFHAVFYFATLTYNVSSKVLSAIKETMPAIFVSIAHLFSKILIPLTILVCIFETAYAAISLKRIYDFSQTIPHALWCDLKKALDAGNKELFIKKFVANKEKYLKLLGEESYKNSIVLLYNGKQQEVYEMVLFQMFSQIDGKFFNLDDNRSAKLAKEANFEAAKAAMQDHIDKAKWKLGNKLYQKVVEKLGPIQGAQNGSYKETFASLKNALNRHISGVSDTMQEDYKRAFETSDTLMNPLLNLLQKSTDILGSRDNIDILLPLLEKHGWNGQFTYQDHATLLEAFNKAIKDYPVALEKDALETIYRQAVEDYKNAKKTASEEAAKKAITKHIDKCIRTLGKRAYISDIEPRMKLQTLSKDLPEKDIPGYLAQFCLALDNLVPNIDNTLVSDYEKKKADIYFSLVDKKVVRAYTSFANLAGKATYQEFSTIAATYHEEGKIPSAKIEKILNTIKTQTAKKTLMHCLGLLAITLTILTVCATGVGAPAIVGMVLLGLSLTITGINYSFESSVLPSSGWRFDANRMIPEPLKNFSAYLTYKFFFLVSMVVHMMKFVVNPRNGLEVDPLYVPQWARDRLDASPPQEAPITSYISTKPIYN